MTNNQRPKPSTIKCTACGVSVYTFALLDPNRCLFKDCPLRVEPHDKKDGKPKMPDTKRKSA